MIKDEDTFLSLPVISSLGVLPIIIGMLKAEENHCCLFKGVETLVSLFYETLFIKGILRR